MLLVLLGVLAAAPTAASTAEGLAKAEKWDELYLLYAQVKAESLPKADLPRIAPLLAKGCRALLDSDAVLALSLGEKSVAFKGPADGVLCAADAAQKGDQGDAAISTLTAGAKLYPKDPRIALELGRALVNNAEADAALAALAKIPKGAKEAAEAQRLSEQARRIQEAVAKARAEHPPDPEEDAPPSSVGRVTGSTASWESSVDDEGRRTRGNSHFRFRYFNGKRDFGQRADYEGSVQGALEDARSSVKRLLGEARDQPLDVVLYSREEFTLHHGPAAAQAVAGFYSQNAIRMNDSAEMSSRVQATLVHEYTHAVVDELASFNTFGLPVWVNEGLAEFLEWRYEGHDSAPVGVANALRMAAESNRVPSLAQLSRGPLIGQGNPALLYALSATAVKLMVSRVGLGRVVELIRSVGRGTPFERAFKSVLGEDLATFEEGLKGELKTR